MTAGLKRDEGMRRAVVFDLYETLITEFGPGRPPAPPVASQLGVSDAAFAALWRARHRARITGGLDCREVLREARRDAGLPPDEALVERLYQQRLQTKALPYARVEAPLLHTLAEIKRRGLRLGLLSDCAPEDAAPWPASPLAPLFDAAVFSYQVGTAKPDPACYHIVCARLGVPPAQALFVGDGAHDELAGAAHAGLVPYRAEWFRDRWPDWQRARPDRASAMAFPSLGTLAELLAAVDAAGA